MSNNIITIVSGLPRSGTSLMMRMLAAGGMDVVTDGERSADEDNPRGYFELEAVKRTDADASWLVDARGKAVKVISALLVDLPPGHLYRVIFMRRRLDEVLASQKVMLERRGEPQASPDAEMKELLASHVAAVERTLRAGAHFQTLYVSYNRLLEEPGAQIARLNGFLSGALDPDKMLAAVEPGLYRQRR